MITCGDGCPTICDFCRHYDFNGDEHGAYTGDGWCRLWEEQREPFEDCDEFYCFVVYSKMIRKIGFTFDILL